MNSIKEFRFRNLRADEIEVRSANVTSDYVKVLLYKTARTDADILDETFGPWGWTNKSIIQNGVPYAYIGIPRPDTGEIVWKQDCGQRNEDDIDPDKAAESDAFKRAGFKWGIGRRALYTAPDIYISSSQCKIEKKGGDRFVCYTKFVVSAVSYDETGKINGILIANAKTGEVVWSMNPENCAKKDEKAKAKPKAKAKVPAPEEEKVHRCADCGVEIQATKGNDGKEYAAWQVADITHKRYGRCLCPECSKVAEAGLKKGA